MPFSIDFSYIDPEIIDLLIKKEKEDQNNSDERPFLQIPAPNQPINIKEVEMEEKESIIVIDL